MTEFQFFLP